MSPAPNTSPVPGPDRTAESTNDPEPTRPADDRLRRYLDLALHVFDTSAAVISVVDDEQEWFRVRRNVEQPAVTVDLAPGAQTVRTEGAFVIEDAAEEDQWADLPLTIGSDPVRFYAGAPVSSPAGDRAGTIAVMDTAPRSPTPDKRVQLETLADLVTELLDGPVERPHQQPSPPGLAECTDANTVVLDRDGTIQQVTAEWKELTNATAPDDAPLREGLDYFETGAIPLTSTDEAHANRARSGIDAVLRGDATTVDMVYPCKPEKETRWFRMRVLPIDLPDARVLISHVDVTEQKKKQRQRRFLETAVEQARDVVLITEAAPLSEPGPRIVYVNPAFTEVTGYELEEVIGKTPRILQGPNTEPWVLEAVREKLRRVEPFEGEAINYKKDGTPYVNHWSIAPVHDENGTLTHWVSVQRDVTEDRHVKKRLLEAQEEERRRIGQEMHDEMGGLLASLQMGVAAAEPGTDDDLPLSDIKHRINALSNVVRTLTERLYSRVLEDYGLSRALTRLVKEFRERDHLTVTLDNDLAEGQRLPSLLEKVAYRGIREALSNVAEHAKTDRAHVAVGLESKILRLQVRDEGQGFDSSHVLDDEQGPHGLSTIKKRVEQMNGKLEIETVSGSGTRFTMRFPLTPITLRS